MALQNNLVKSSPQQGKKKFSVLIKEDTYKNLINSTLQDQKRATRFIANISTAVALNPKLNECDPSTLLSAGLVAETLNLPLNQSFGRAFLIPFDEKEYNPQTRKRETVRTVCQLQLGYKALIELALRSGQYKSITATEVREGEYLGRSEETAEPMFSFITDDDIREEKDIIGYMASFVTIYGFTKKIYFTKKKMETHAETYSTAYSSDKKYGTTYSFWSKSFTEMALKTMLRQLLSKWGVLSVELQEAFVKDQAVIKANGDVEYVDNQPENEVPTTYVEAPVVEETPVVEDTTNEIKGQTRLEFGE